MHCQHFSVLGLALGTPSAAWQAACLALMLTGVLLTVSAPATCCCARQSKRLLKINNKRQRKLLITKNKKVKLCHPHGEHSAIGAHDTDVCLMDISCKPILVGECHLLKGHN